MISNKFYSVFLVLLLFILGCSERDEVYVPMLMPSNITSAELSVKGGEGHLTITFLDGSQSTVHGLIQTIPPVRSFVLLGDQSKRFEFIWDVAQNAWLCEKCLQLKHEVTPAMWKKK